MSEENVEAFKRSLAAGNRGDVEALLAELDPKVEWHAALPMLGGEAVYRGHEGVREFLLDVWEVIADTEFDFPEIRDVGDKVVGLGHFRGRGKGSGVETETPFAYVAQFRGGKAIRVRAYLDPQQALAAIGLSE
jgi:ketosteroid isomerase-like protein